MHAGSAFLVHDTEGAPGRGDAARLWPQRGGQLSKRHMRATRVSSGVCFTHASASTAAGAAPGLGKHLLWA